MLITPMIRFALFSQWVCVIKIFIIVGCMGNSWKDWYLLFSSSSMQVHIYVHSYFWKPSLVNLSYTIGTQRKVIWIYYCLKYNNIPVIIINFSSVASLHVSVFLFSEISFYFIENRFISSPMWTHPFSVSWRNLNFHLQMFINWRLLMD